MVRGISNVLCRWHTGYVDNNDRSCAGAEGNCDPTPVLPCIFSVFSYNLLVRKIKIMFLKGDIQHGREEFYAVNMKTHPS